MHVFCKQACGSFGAQQTANSALLGVVQVTHPLCPAFHPTLCAGLAPRYPLYQRVALMQLVRSLLSDPVVTYHLFASYDLAVDRKLDAVQVCCTSRECWIGWAVEMGGRLVLRWQGGIPLISTIE